MPLDPRQMRDIPMLEVFAVTPSDVPIIAELAAETCHPAMFPLNNQFL
ncbi:hypothetical protein AB0H60_07735 [Nocardia rhamnosiphila]